MHQRVTVAHALRTALACSHVCKHRSLATRFDRTYLFERLGMAARVLSSSPLCLSGPSTRTRARAPRRSRRHRVADAPAQPACRATGKFQRCWCGLCRREQLQQAVGEEDTALAGPSSLGTRGPRRRPGSSCGRPDEQWQALAAPCVRVRPHLAAATLRQITRRATGGVRKALLQNWKRGPLSRAAMER